MEIEKIVIPYNKVKDLKFKKRLILEFEYENSNTVQIHVVEKNNKTTNYEEGGFHFIKFFQFRKLNYITNSEEKDKKKFFYISVGKFIKYKTPDSKLEGLKFYGKDYTINVINLMVTTNYKRMLVEYAIHFEFKNEKIRDRVFNDQDYLNLIADRFQQWIEKFENDRKIV